MKEIDLGDGKRAKYCVEYGDKQPQLERPPVKPGQKTYQDGFRSVTVKIIVTKDGQELAEYKGVSYCSPTDRWDRIEGRRMAVRRAFDQDNKQAAAKAEGDQQTPSSRQQLEPFKVLNTHARSVLARKLLPWLFETEEQENNPQTA